MNKYLVIRKSIPLGKRRHSKMSLVWNTPHTNLFKWWFLDVEETLCIVKPVLVEYYLALAREEETLVKLPTIMGLAKYRHLNTYPWRAGLTREACLLLCRSENTTNYEVLVSEELNPLLLLCGGDGNGTTHSHLLNTLVLLFSGGGHSRRDAQFMATRDMLVAAAIHLGYGDILWVYSYRLMNPSRHKVQLFVGNERTTNLLLGYLREQTCSMMSVVTVTETFEMRTMAFFRSVVSLLVRSARLDEAVDICEWARRVLRVEDPLFYLSESDKGEIYSHLFTGHGVA